MSFTANKMLLASVGAGTSQESYIINFSSYPSTTCSLLSQTMYRDLSRPYLWQVYDKDGTAFIVTKWDWTNGELLWQKEVSVAPDSTGIVVQESGTNEYVAICNTQSGNIRVQVLDENGDVVSTKDAQTSDDYRAGDSCFSWGPNDEFGVGNARANVYGFSMEYSSGLNANGTAIYTASGTGASQGGVNISDGPYFSNGKVMSIFGTNRQPTILQCDPDGSNSTNIKRANNTTSYVNTGLTVDINRAGSDEVVIYGSTYSVTSNIDSYISYLDSSLSQQWLVGFDVTGPNDTRRGSASINESATEIVFSSGSTNSDAYIFNHFIDDLSTGAFSSDCLKITPTNGSVTNGWCNVVYLPNDYVLCNMFFRDSGNNYIDPCWFVYQRSELGNFNSTYGAVTFSTPSSPLNSRTPAFTNFASSSVSTETSTWSTSAGLSTSTSASLTESKTAL